MLAGAAVVAGGCGAEAQNTPQSLGRDSAGIRIVTAPGDDTPLPWSWRARVDIGGAMAGAESFFDIDAASVAIGPTGEILILDEGNKRVLVFGPDGRHLRTIGREGEGPGELGRPVGLSVGPGGVLHVLDNVHHGFVRYMSAGEALEPLPVSLPYWSDRIEYLLDAFAMVITAGRRSAADSVADQLVLWDGTSLDTIASLRRPRPEMYDYTGCVNIALDPLFAPEIAWDGEDRTILASSGAAYEIDVFREGRQVASYRRAVVPRPVTRENALAALDEGLEVKTPFGSCSIDPEEMLEVRGFAPALQAIVGLTLAPSGEIWVQRGHFEEEPGRIDILDPDGRYVGTLPEGFPFPVAFTPEGDPVVLVSDELDVQHVQVLEVDRG